MRDNIVIGTVAAITVLSSGLAIAFCLSGGLGPNLDPAPHQAVGKVLARQALSLLKPEGTITVIARDTSVFQNPATDIELASFRNELRKAGVATASVKLLQVDPLRPVGVPAGDFFAWIKKETKGSVIVSLMGPPIFSDAQLAQLGEIKPAIVAFCSGPLRDQVDLRSFFARGLLQAAVVSKHNVTVTRAASEREAFDCQFVAVTSDNLAGLSTASNSTP
jgi:hypothetical protein